MLHAGPLFDLLFYLLVFLALDTIATNQHILFACLSRRSPEKCRLFAGSLELSVSHFGCCIDEFDVDFLGGIARRAGEEVLSEGDDSLARTHDTALEHDVIVGDDTVV